MKECEELQDLLYEHSLKTYELQDAIKMIKSDVKKFQRTPKGTRRTQAEAEDWSS